MVIPRIAWRCLVGVCCALWAGSCVALGQTDFELPTDLEEPVVELAYQGGAYARWVGDDSAVMLQIFADGRVIAGGYAPHVPACTWEISQRELQAFYRELTEDLSVFAIDSQRIRQQLGERTEHTTVGDAPTTVVRVRSVNQVHVISLHGAAFFAREFPDIEGLAQFQQVESKLRWIAAVATIGGFQELDGILKEIRAYGEQVQLDLPPLKREDVSSAARLNDGALTVIVRCELPQEDDTTPRQMTFSYRRSNNETTIHHTGR